MFGFTKINRSTVQAIGLAAICCLLLTGCVGPMACGPAGCGTGSCDSGACGIGGPIAVHGSSSCDGGCSAGCDGCGRLYVDPWINHPADSCDPCDHCGNYNGQSCGKCRSVFGGIKSLWGYRCGDECGACDSCEVTCGSGALHAGTECGCGMAACGGCGIEASCGCDGGCDSCGGMSYMSGQPTLVGETIVNGESINEVGTIVSEPYAPERTKKIFRNRQAVRGSVPNASDF